MKTIYITEINNKEKRKRVSDILKKYTSLSWDFSTNIIKFEFNYSSNRTEILSVSEVVDCVEPGISYFSFDNSIFSFPDEVIDLLISKSKQKSINPFIIDIGPLEGRGGFNWGETEEGFDYWKNLICNKDFSCLKMKVCVYSTRITETNGDRLKRINEVLQKYTKLKTSAINLDLEAILYTKISGESIELLNNLSEVDSKDVAVFVEETQNYNDSIFSYPDKVIDLLISKTKSKTINPFIRSVKSGFEWDKSEEGFSYWDEIIEHRNYSKIIKKGRVVKLSITGIDTDKKKDQVCKFIDKYMNELGFLKSEILNSSLGFEIEIGDVQPGKCKTYKLLSLAIGGYKMEASIKDFEDTILSYPFEIVDKLIEHSESKNVLPFLYNLRASKVDGGFDWKDTAEGHEYWENLIINKQFEISDKKEKIIVEITEIDSQEKKEAISKLLYSNVYIDPQEIGDSIGFRLDIKQEKSGWIQDVKLLNVILEPSCNTERVITKEFYYSIFNQKPETIDLLLSRSRIKNNLFVYLLHPAATKGDGGFDWGRSPEKFDYWSNLIRDKRFKTLNSEMEKDLEKVKVLGLDTKEKVERLKYVFSKYIHYPITGFELDKKHGIEIGIRTNRSIGIGSKLNSAQVIQVTRIDKESDKFSGFDFDNSVFCVPDKILDRLVELSSLKSLVPYILNLFAIEDEGGFNWEDTKEGKTYWNNILGLKKFENTYKSLSTMCKINYKTKKLISKEANEEKKVDFYVRETQLNVENELLNREKERAGVDEDLNDLKSSYPLNLEAIIKNQERLEELDTEIKIIKSLKKELGFEKEDKTKEKEGK